jgi:hypothetical protein
LRNYANWSTKSTLFISVAASLVQYEEVAKLFGNKAIEA